MVIDAHVHLYPAEINCDPLGWAMAAGEPHWATLATRRRKDGRPVQGFPSVEALVREMDAAGVDRVILQGWYWQTQASCAAQNRFYAACVAAHPDRLSGCATFHPSVGTAGIVACLREARDAGLIGLGELSPQSQGYAVGDPVLAEALALAAMWRWPVNLHVTDPRSRPFPGRVETPLAEIDWLVSTYPDVVWVLAHWGGGEPLQRTPPPSARGAILYDTAASPLLYGQGQWSRVGGDFGEGSVLFGSDYPLDNYPRASGETLAWGRLVREAGAGMDPSVADAVMGQTAARWYGLRGLRSGGVEG